jgi:tetratricopeptide (TPR) repeat protein
MKGFTIVLAAGLAFGQTQWEEHMKQGDSWVLAGRYHEARAAYALAVKDEINSSDSGHRLAAARNSLGLILVRLGRYAEAGNEYRQALKLLERSRGPRSIEYAGCLVNLGVLDYNEGRLNDAEHQLRRALKLQEDLLGEEHATTAQTLNNLSAVLAQRGRYADAERYCRRALSIQESKLGADHPQISATLDNLASLCRRRSNLEEALKLSIRGEGIARKTYGERHPDTCIRANKVAVLYADLKLPGKRSRCCSESWQSKQMCWDRRARMFPPRRRTWRRFASA